MSWTKSKSHSRNHVKPKLSKATKLCGTLKPMNCTLFLITNVTSWCTTRESWIQTPSRLFLMDTNEKWFLMRKGCFEVLDQPFKEVVGVFLPFFLVDLQACWRVHWRVQWERPLFPDNLWPHSSSIVLWKPQPKETLVVLAAFTSNRASSSSIIWPHKHPVLLGENSCWVEVALKMFSKPNWTLGQHSNQCLHHALLMGQ